MAIYFVLIFSILLASPMSKRIYSSKDKQEKFVLIIGVLFLYLICVLRKDTVGGDIAGYKVLYERAGNVSWSNYTEFGNFEDGYILLTKICSKAGISFQWFFVIIYAIMYIPLAKFMYKNSKDVAMSLIIYVCYQLFVFNLSGLRQSIAMGMCLSAISFATRTGLKNFLNFLLIVLLASTIHSSAIVFFAFYFVIRIKMSNIKAIIYFALCAMVVFMRGSINAFLTKYFRETDASITLGGAFVLLLGITLFYFISNGTKWEEPTYENIGNKKCIKLESVSMQILMFCILMYLAFSGSTLLRATMYYVIFIIIVLPNCIQKYNSKERKLIRWIVIVFMIMLFYSETLAINQFYIVPYKFFWQ